MDIFLKKDPLNNWNTVPPVPADKIININCHKFTLYIIGKISWEDMISDIQSQKESGIDFTFGKKAQNISAIPFTPVKDLRRLNSLANKYCEVDKSYIGQILDAQTGEMAHSFIIQRRPDDTYTCFEKTGFKYPFNVCNLDTIFNFINKDGEKSNQNQKWRFVPIEDVSKK